MNRKVLVLEHVESLDNNLISLENAIGKKVSADVIIGLLKQARHHTEAIRSHVNLESQSTQIREQRK